MTRIKEDIMRDIMTQITHDRKLAKTLVEAILKIVKGRSSPFKEFCLRPLRIAS